jgi:hypothetical protein
MRRRRKSISERASNVAPIAAIVGTGIAGVFLAMNVLVTSPPVLTNFASSDTSGGPSFPATPSILPFATDTTLVTQVPVASLPDNRPTIVNSAVSESAPNGVWTVYLGYPAFVAGTTPWADAIDTDILDEIQTRASQWEEGPAANRQATGKVNSLSGSFTMELLTPALASFTLTWVDNSAATTPATGVETLNYDLSTGQRIAFQDLFGDPATALAIISSSSLPLLQAELGPDYDSSIAIEGTSPSTTNYLHWALTKDGVKITFAQYQVAARGPALPSVVVPWTSLRNVMAQTGPIATLAGF